MKKICFPVLFFLIMSSNVSATILTVDNNYPSIGNFTTLQAAHDAADPGDTLYVLPSDFAYAAITVTRKLTFVGSGYDLVQPTLKTSKIKGTLSFEAGSNGSVIEGFDSFSNEFIIVVDANSVMVQKNKLCRTIIKPHHSGVTIQQNFLLYTGMQTNGPCNVTAFAIFIDHSNAGILIENNKIVNSTLNWSCNETLEYGNGICIADSSVVTILNNIIKLSSSFDCGHSALPYIVSPSATSDYFIANNIFLHGRVIGNALRYSHNMYECGTIGTENGNLLFANWNAVFMDVSQFNFHLKPGSPAFGAGQGGVDLGIYGGNTLYDDNGYPGIPAIYYLDVPYNGSQQNGVNVTIKAKSNPN
jgi:hypothetical protein